MYENVQEQTETAYDSPNVSGEMVAIFEKQVQEMHGYKLPFDNLQRFAKDPRTIEMAIGCIIEFSKDKFLSSLTGNQASEVLAASLSQLNNQLIVDNPIFSYLGDLFMTVT